jgi:hypothetical protein
MSLERLLFSERFRDYGNDAVRQRLLKCNSRDDASSSPINQMRVDGMRGLFKFSQKLRTDRIPRLHYTGVSACERPILNDASANSQRSASQHVMWSNLNKAWIDTKLPSDLTPRFTDKTACGLFADSTGLDRIKYPESPIRHVISQRQVNEISSAKQKQRGMNLETI